MSLLSNRLINWGMTKPRLVNSVHSLVDFIPPLRLAIERRVSNVMDENNKANEAGNSITHTKEDSTAALRDTTLTPFGKRIYAKLNAGIEINNKGSL